MQKQIKEKDNDISWVPLAIVLIIVVRVFLELSEFLIIKQQIL